MPPKKQGPRNVVKSGNAGNSSKSKPAAKQDGTQPLPFGAGGDQPKRLFPVGYKTPVTILNEKCQKEGWERPIIDSHRNPNSDPPTYSASVTLRRRKGKSIDQFDIVRMTPIPRIEEEDSAMARHYGAVYALFRIYNNMPLALLLPPIIRPYWTTLTKEKAQAPSHRDWEWSSDPFAAKKEVEDRQAKRTANIEAHSNGNVQAHNDAKRWDVDAKTVVQGKVRIQDSDRGHKRGWQNVPEVKMTVAQREIVEDLIRKMMSRFPSAILQATRESGSTPSTAPSGTSTPVFDAEAIRPQLLDLGFRPAHVTSCLNALAAAHARMHRGATTTLNDPLTLSLSILSPFEAAIEWLLVHLPEDDLPRAYRTERTSDMITGVSSDSIGKQGLVKGWIVDKLVKQAGFPRKIVEPVVKHASSETDALDTLGRMLCGWTARTDGTLDPGRDAAREEELMVLRSLMDDRIKEDKNEITITGIRAGSDDLNLHIILSEDSPYPAPEAPPSFYLTSNTLPSYIKLHLHRRLLERFKDDLAETLVGGGSIFAMVEALEEDLPMVLEHPPDIASVTEHLIPRPQDDQDSSKAGQKKRKTFKRQRERMAPRPAQNESVLAAYNSMKTKSGYAQMLAARSKLPAWNERNKVNELLATNRVLLVVGETGCGKSTQIPSFILDHNIENGKGGETSILVTQPRRVSAMGLASRVAEERMEDLDTDIGMVGYTIRGESKVRPGYTRLTFATTGVVLRRLSAGGDANLDGISHIIVDEYVFQANLARQRWQTDTREKVHERSVDGDFLLLQLKELLQRNDHIKVILMSATVNQDLFIKYFGGIPVLEIPGFTHPVKDLIKQTEDQKAALRASLENLSLTEHGKSAVEAVTLSTQIPYDLIGSIVKHIQDTSPKQEDGVLVFLPGVAEIRNAIDSIRSKCPDVSILPLHANLSNDEQRKVFAPTKSRKVVVATNVAETSITIPEIVYVIDAGKVKETQYEADTGLSKLTEVWASRAACRQRRGRAGRTKPGICYKLFSRRVEDLQMAKYTVPEILRTPLESLFLQIKAMDPDADVKEYLLRAIDPPKIQALDAAWKTLIDLGAVEGEEMTSRLTALGRYMSALPVDLRLGKMLVLGCIFRALDPALTIAAMLSSKPLFSSPMEKREEARKQREKFAWAKSDILLNLRAFDAVQELPGWSAKRSFCEEHFISFSAFRDISSLRQDFYDALRELGFVSRNRQEMNANAQNENLLKGILTGAFYPRVASIRPPDAQYQKMQSGTLVKDHEAKEVKFYDEHGRVFIHPGSILFTETSLKLGYLTYFHKAETSKTFLFDATEIPLFCLLLFGGQVTVNHFAGGVTVGSTGHIRMRAWSRVGILVNQIRRLLDASLQEAMDDADETSGSEAGRLLEEGGDVIKAILALLN